MENNHMLNADNSSFDEILTDTVAEILPEKVVNSVTPWKRSMCMILTGIGLSTVMLNFLCLEYILPAIGVILMLLGFRSMRCTNKWFMGCFIATCLRAAIIFPLLILNTTLFHLQADATPQMTVLTVLNVLLPALIALMLGLGICRIQKDTGIPKKTNAAVGIFIWYIPLTALAILNFTGVIVPVVMIIIFILLIKSLYKLSLELDASGYIIKTAPVRVNDRAVAITTSLCLIIGCTCGYIFGGSYKQNWKERSPAEHESVIQIKEELLSLGFPENILNDISAEDIAACGGATSVTIKTTSGHINKGTQVRTADPDDPQHFYIRTEYSHEELLLTGVGVFFENDNKITVFHHFLWQETPHFFGTESLQLWPEYENSYTGMRLCGDVTGRILYNKEKTFVSDFYSLERSSYTSTDTFLGTQSRSDIFAEFSMPNGGTAYRGYLTYTVTGDHNKNIFNSWLNYTHQTLPVIYPNTSAAQRRKTNMWNDTFGFKTVQSELLF